MDVHSVAGCPLRTCYQRIHEETWVLAATPGKMSLRGRAALFLRILTHVHSYQAPMKLSVPETPMHFPVTDIPFCSRTRIALSSFRKVWVNSVQTLQTRNWCWVSRDMMEMDNVGNPLSHNPSICSLYLTGPTFAQIRDLDCQDDRPSHFDRCRVSTGLACLQLLTDSAGRARLIDYLCFTCLQSGCLRGNCTLVCFIYDIVLCTAEPFRIPTEVDSEQHAIYIVADVDTSTISRRACM
jgi:hypothetical protein